MHALHEITLKRCHIVAMSMTFRQLYNSVINIADISSALVKTLSKVHRSRESRQRRASRLVYNISDVGDVLLVTTTSFQERYIFIY